MSYLGRVKNKKGIWGKWESFATLEEARRTCELYAKDGVISGEDQIQICTEDEFRKRYETEEGDK